MKLRTLFIKRHQESEKASRHISKEVIHNRNLSEKQIKQNPPKPVKHWAQNLSTLQDRLSKWPVNTWEGAQPHYSSGKKQYKATRRHDYISKMSKNKAW